MRPLSSSALNTNKVSAENRGSIVILCKVQIYPSIYLQISLKAPNRMLKILLDLQPATRKRENMLYIILIFIIGEGKVFLWEPVFPDKRVFLGPLGMLSIYKQFFPFNHRLASYLETYTRCLYIPDALRPSKSNYLRLLFGRICTETCEVR